jgi:hypothetical protein
MKALKSILSIIITSAGMFVNTGLDAQSKLQDLMSMDGFLVNNGDTLFGSVYMKQKYLDNHPYSLVFTGRDNIKKEYTAGTVAAVGVYSIPGRNEFGDLQSHSLADYESIPSPKSGGNIFALRLIDGKIKVFQNRSAGTISSSKTMEMTKFDGIGFRFSPEEGLVIGPRFRTSYQVIDEKTRYTSYFIQKDNGAVLKISKDNYEELYPALFDDCPAIKAETDKNPDLKKFKNFMLLVEIYDQLCL